MLKLLHTANWHVGRTFGLFTEQDAEKLRRARVTAVENIFGLAERFDVDAVLCAGDLFDQPSPDEGSWRDIKDILIRAASSNRPIILLPGSHDPLVADSPYGVGHGFRRELPSSVHIVDDDHFELPLANGVLYAAPCRASAGDKDTAMALPNRAADDNRIRVGLAYGVATDETGNSNHPLSVSAPMERGLDYLASGSRVGWQEISTDGPAPIVYPGTPEPTNFGEEQSGYVALVSIRSSGARPRVKQERVSKWVWRDETVSSLEQLISLGEEDLKSTVLRLRLQLTVDMHEVETLEQTISRLQGTVSSIALAGAFVCDRSGLQVNVSDWSIENMDLPDTICVTVSRLQSEVKNSDSKSDIAQRALLLMQKLLKEKGAIT